MGNRTYIDIGAKRIQTWISKPLKLKYVTGASLRLKEATSDKEITRWLADQNVHDFIIARDAGSIDGVVVLEALADKVDARRVKQVATALLLYLNERLPSVEWYGWSCTASDFLSAFQRSKDEENLDAIYELAPAVKEFPAVFLCEGCEMEFSTRSIGHVNEKLGPDCSGRFGDLEERDAARERHERRKHRERARWGQEEIYPQDFSILATRLGEFATANQNNPHYKKRPRNHIATICADGNRIGYFFDALSEHDELQAFKTDAVLQLNKTMKKAVDAAVNQATVNEKRKAGSPHYVGGDDVLVSVAADEAWRFAITLIEHFEKFRVNFQQKLQKLHQLDPRIRTDVQRLLNEVSLGVGMVFSHYAYPFYECRHQAEKALTKAKQRSSGKKSEICWIDLTEDGGDSYHTTARHVIDFQTAKAQLDDARKLPELMTLNSTALHNLHGQWIAWLQQDGTTADNITPEQREKYQEYVNTWFERTGRRPRGTDDESIDISNIEADLSRARWWPYVAGELTESTTEKDKK